jgi:hypothetical protein
MAILSKYKSRYPKDDLRPAELAEALEKVYPALYPDESESAMGGLTILPKHGERNTNATSTKSSEVRNSSIDVETTGTDFGAVGSAANVRSLSAQPDRLIAVALTKRADSRGHSTRASSSTIQSTLRRGNGCEASYAKPDSAKLAANNEFSQRPLTSVEMEVSKEQSTEPTMEERERSNFEEFENAMRNLGPGGAFAEAHVPFRTRRQDGGGADGKSAPLDVMHWDV